MDDIQQKVKESFEKTFGRTPLKQRLDDILNKAIELNRCVDIKKIREELGDLLASAIMLSDECGLHFEVPIEETLEKIERRKIQYQTLGRKTEVAIFGGAFDPVSTGHIQVAQFILNTSKTFDEVWLLPAHEHMYGKNMVSPEHRLEMCRLAAKVDARIKVCDYEISNKLKGETFQTVKLLKEEKIYKDKYNFSWIIGLDNANSFDKWVNYEYLEKIIRFVVVPRKGYQLNPKVNWFLKPPHIYLNDIDNVPVEEISSTKIREWMKTGHESTAEKYLHPDVFEYINKNDIY